MEKSAVCQSVKLARLSTEKVCLFICTVGHYHDIDQKCDFLQLLLKIILKELWLGIAKLFLPSREQSREHKKYVVKTFQSKRGTVDKNIELTTMFKNFSSVY